MDLEEKASAKRLRLMLAAAAVRTIMPLQFQDAEKIAVRIALKLETALHSELLEEKL